MPLLFPIFKPSLIADPLVTLPREVVAPEWFSNASVIEVFPASTWAKIPRVNTFLSDINLTVKF
jgi:hypothetical protein